MFSTSDSSQERSRKEGERRRKKVVSRRERSTAPQRHRESVVMADSGERKGLIEDGARVWRGSIGGAQKGHLIDIGAPADTVQGELQTRTIMQDMGTAQIVMGKDTPDTKVPA